MTQAGAPPGDEGVKPRPLNSTFSELPTTIFTVMTNLSIKHNSINLGQGGLHSCELSICGTLTRLCRYLRGASALQQSGDVRLDGKPRPCRLPGC